MIIYFNYFLNSVFLLKNATPGRIFYGERDTSEFCPSFKPGTKWLSVQRKHLSFTKLNVNLVARYPYLLVYQIAVSGMWYGTDGTTAKEDA